MKIILNTVNIYKKKVENGYEMLENKISYRIYNLFIEKIQVSKQSKRQQNDF